MVLFIVIMGLAVFGLIGSVYSSYKYSKSDGGDEID